ncbi:MAG: alpha-E domain-containing protein [Gemmatimonadetes bacterium]|nr:alpha-E domain-containing protein [Gemmatimonadota bacterium]MYA76470.1 alpha-E domain-containing protein [Gemmatimonadota bacterium]MYG16396.1 alpha-E domain-containing protein [Gemmatimonadota bacterium]MYH17615.1 alpha-E domain-containing protein [Gemmatimonadota bacterium]
MLSRSAQGLYWMGRYLERAAHLSRLMQLQVETLVDRPLREIHFGWNRVYSSMSQLPPAGTLEAFGSDDYALADSYTLADHLTFEPTNPDSIWNCFAYARENARQARNYISAEMWLSLNLTFLRLQGLTIQEIWKTAPESFYAGTAKDIATFTGVAEATMYRDEGWHFIQLGRYIERVQLSASVLLAQIAAQDRQDESFDADWANLLHVFRAFDAYVHAYSVVVQPGQVLDLIVTDALLPGSLRRSLDAIASVLDAIGSGPSPDASREAVSISASLCVVVRDGRNDVSAWSATLEQVNGASRKLHRQIMDAYIDYPLESLAVR